MIEGRHEMEPNMSTIPEQDRKLRQVISDYTTSDAAAPQVQDLQLKVKAQWEQWNAMYFDGQLVTPMVIFTQPGKPQALGEYSTTSVHGSRGEVRIRPTIPEGRHPLWECNNPKRPIDLPPAPEPTEEQRMRYTIDVALHETVHQWQDEIHGTKAIGHNAKFRDKCNEIGRELGLGPVRGKLRKDSPDTNLPFCGQWPHCVRPEGYYGHLREDHEDPRRTREEYRLIIASLLYGYAVETESLPAVSEANAALRWVAGEIATQALDLMDEAIKRASDYYAGSQHEAASRAPEMAANTPNVPCTSAALPREAAE